MRTRRSSTVIRADFWARTSSVRALISICVFVSPGGYICGEETALMEAIEGKRAEPRNKPPSPVNKGFGNMPTALNNVETFALAVTHPGEGRGVVQRHRARTAPQGLKFVGVSGDVQDSGSVRSADGDHLSRIDRPVCGRAAGGQADLSALRRRDPRPDICPPSMLDLPLDWNVDGGKPVRWWDRAPSWCARSAPACWTWR